MKINLKSRVPLFTLGLAIACGAAVNAHAQIGSGWTEIFPNKSLQLVGSGWYQNNNGVETFGIANSSTTTQERAEQRVLDDYSSGSHQFQGDVKVTSLDGDVINLKQTFQANDGAWFLATVDAASGGTLRDHSNGAILATGIIGKTIRLNTIHDMSANKFYVFVDGILVETRSGGVAPFYDKYGTYRAASGQGPVTAQWSKVHYWTGGSPYYSFSGAYEIQNVTSGQALNNGGLTSNGAPVSQWNWVGSINEKWQFIPTSNGYFQINSLKSGKDVAVEGSSTSDGANLVQWSFGSAGNDQWKPVKNNNGTWTFFNLHSGKVLNNSGGSTTQGSQYSQWTWLESPNEEFNLIPQ